MGTKNKNQNNKKNAIVKPIAKKEIYKFGINQRIVLANCIEGKTYETAIIADGLKKKLAITPKEVEKFEIKQTGNTIGWNAEGAKHKLELTLTDNEKEVLKKAYLKINEKELYSLDMQENYEKIVIGK